MSAQAEFEALLDPYLERLALYVRRRAGGAVAADWGEEDVVQTVLATAWRLFPRYEDQGPAALWGWLAALADGAIADRVKYRHAKGRDDVLPLEPGREPRDPRTSITRLAARRELRRRVEEALATLEEAQREVVERHLLHGESLADIARAQGVTKNAVWERLQRGLARVREAVDA